LNVTKSVQILKFTEISIAYRDAEPDPKKTRFTNFSVKYHLDRYSVQHVARPWTKNIDGAVFYDGLIAAGKRVMVINSN